MATIAQDVPSRYPAFHAIPQQCGICLVLLLPLSVPVCWCWYVAPSVCDRIVPQFFATLPNRSLHDCHRTSPAPQDVHLPLGEAHRCSWGKLPEGVLYCRSLLSLLGCRAVAKSLLALRRCHVGLCLNVSELAGYPQRSIHQCCQMDIISIPCSRTLHTKMFVRTTVPIGHTVTS